MNKPDVLPPEGCAPPRSHRTVPRRQALGGLIGTAALGTLTSTCGPAQPIEGRSPRSRAASPRAGATPSGPTAVQAHPEQAASQPLFRVLDVAGSHRDIGHAIGETFRDVIAAALQEQSGFATCCQRARGPLRKRVAAYDSAARAAFPTLMAELEAMAEACGIPAADLFAWNCRSELDAAADPCPPGCSTVGWADDERMLLAHNEDGHAAYAGRMFVVRARPPSGVSFAALVYPGTLPGNGPGLNVGAVVQTTNYISPCEPARGIPRYFIGRAVLEARDLEHAVALAARRQRAFPWHHNLASLSRGELTSLETWPGRHHRRDVRGLHLHTNHLLHAEMADLPERKTYLARSSQPRLATLEQRLRRVTSPDRARLLAALHDRSGGTCKVCRRPGDEVPGVTLATAVFEAPTVSMQLLDGPSCGGPAQTVIPP